MHIALYFIIFFRSQKIQNQEHRKVNRDPTLNSLQQSTTFKVRFSQKKIYGQKSGDKRVLIYMYVVEKGNCLY